MDPLTDLRRDIFDILGAALEEGVGLGVPDPFRDAVLVERHAHQEDEKDQHDRTPRKAESGPRDPVEGADALCPLNRFRQARAVA